MTLQTLLNDHAQEIFNEAYETMRRAPLKSYAQAGAAQTQQRLLSLYELVRRCVEEKKLTPIISHAELVAQARFESGFDLWEVQTAFNVLEETIWRHILKKLSPKEFPEAFALVSTVLGAGKDALACTYVSLAAQNKVPSLNVTSLFAGTEG